MKARKAFSEVWEGRHEIDKQDKSARRGSDAGGSRACATSRGTVAGTVLNPTGAVIGARVTLTAVETGVRLHGEQ
jgi:hypothetical protein